MVVSGFTDDLAKLYVCNTVYLSLFSKVACCMCRYRYVTYVQHCQAAVVRCISISGCHFRYLLCGVGRLLMEARGVPLSSVCSEMQPDSL